MNDAPKNWSNVFEGEAAYQCSFELILLKRKLEILLFRFQGSTDVEGRAPQYKGDNKEVNLEINQR